MRIQEMRSGLPHLRKKLSPDTQDNFFAERIAKEAFIEALSDFITSDEPEVIACDIDQATWSVVSFARVEACGLTYAQAAKLIDDLEANDVAGLCLITDSAASKILKRPSQNSR